MPGAPLSIAMVTGDFDLSGIGTVTHVEGNRVYGFGHPMFSLGSCEFPLMTGYIHTVYPRASVSMKMGSPLKVVGVSTPTSAPASPAALGPKPDMLPVSVRVKVGPLLRPARPTTSRSSASPTCWRARHGGPDQRHRHRGEPARGADRARQGDDQAEGPLPDRHSTTRSAGPGYSGPMGPADLFNPIASIVNILVRNPMDQVRVEVIDCDVTVSPGRTVATIESVSLASDRVEPGQPLTAFVTLKPFKGDRETHRRTPRHAPRLPRGSLTS